MALIHGAKLMLDLPDMSAFRPTHSYATLEISRAAYEEIAAALREADYGHVFIEPRGGGEPIIDMTGIALLPKP